MQQIHPVYGVHRTYNLAGLHLVPRLDRRRTELAVEREPVSVLDQNTFVVAGHDHYLFHHTVEHGLYRLAFGQ